MILFVIRMAEKINFIKKYKEYYTAKAVPSVKKFGKVGYLSIEGKGEPAGESFVEAIESLYPFAYGVKKICKLQERDFGVPKLEGLWWVESEKNALEVPKSQWHWKLLIRMTEFVDAEMVEKARVEVYNKKGLALLKQIEYIEIDEGECVQALHVGPYTTEPETIERMSDYIKDNGYIETGLHHEIYLSDPRKTAPEKLKTILRQPIAKLS